MQFMQILYDRLGNNMRAIDVNCRNGQIGIITSFIFIRRIIQTNALGRNRGLYTLEAKLFSLANIQPLKFYEICNNNCLST